MKRTVPRIVIGALLMLAAGASAAGTSDAASGRRDLPRVDMEAALKSAQWDPQKSDSSVTPGSRASVTRIERALRDEGLLAERYVDGHYGTATVAAYVKWQKSLGYSGVGANGIPGESSLTALGANRFTVVRPVRLGGLTDFGGQTVNRRTAAMLVEVQAVVGLDIELDQGSYSSSDPTSVGTHDGGGVVDINVDDWTDQQRTQVVETLRRVGFAAWSRSPSEGNWPRHIHAVAISDPDLSPNAQAQVGDYFRGRNGLANDGADTGPKVEPKLTWEQYQRDGS